MLVFVFAGCTFLQENPLFFCPSHVGKHECFTLQMTIHFFCPSRIGKQYRCFTFRFTFWQFTISVQFSAVSKHLTLSLEMTTHNLNLSSVGASRTCFFSPWLFRGIKASSKLGMNMSRLYSTIRHNWTAGKVSSSHISETVSWLSCNPSPVQGPFIISPFLQGIADTF